MDVQGIVDAVVEQVKDAPDKAKEFFADPGAAIESITGDKLDTEHIAEVGKGVLEKLKEGGADIVGGLEGLLENSPLSGVVSNIEEKAGEIDLGQAASKVGDALGGIFGKKE